jgi:hypothetical protein
LCWCWQISDPWFAGHERQLRERVRVALLDELPAPPQSSNAQGPDDENSEEERHRERRANLRSSERQHQRKRSHAEAFPLIVAQVTKTPGGIICGS